MNNMKENNKSLLAGLAVIIATVVIVALVGIFAIHPQKEIIAGEADAAEYRVSNMVPGHIDSLYVKEGALVRRGDTLAHIASRQVDAKMLQAEAARSAASAQSRKAQHGARSQQKEMAYQVWQKAQAAEEVYRKSYERVKGLHEKGVVAQQKLDEVEAKYKVAQADCAAAEPSRAAPRSLMTLPCSASNTAAKETGGDRGRETGDGSNVI